MIKNYLLLLALCYFASANAQIINFPDPSFKMRLLSIDRFNSKAKDKFGNYTAIDLNGNSEIEVSEAENITYLDLYSATSQNFITSLDGIINFSNLQTLICNNNRITAIDLKGLVKLMDLDCSSNKITSLDVTGLVNLQEIDCAVNELQTVEIKDLTNLKILSFYQNKLTSLKISGCPEIFTLYCEFNELTSLDISTLVNLDRFYCSNNKLAGLDFTNTQKIKYLHCENNKFEDLNLTSLVKLEDLRCDENPLLTTIFMKFGSKYQYSLKAESCPNLQYICVDENRIAYVQNIVKQYGYKNCNVNSYCSFIPGGTFYTIKGNNKFDVKNDGCVNAASFVSNLKFSITDGTVKGGLISDLSGYYSIPVQAGTHTIVPILENPDYYNISPASIKITFPSNANSITQDFCISLKDPKADLEIIVIPLDAARPGFDVRYKIVYKNKGNFEQSGSINFTYNDAILDLVNSLPLISTQALNNLTWNFADLKPFESREIVFSMNLNSPTEIPAVNNNDILKFDALINSSQIDLTPNDNLFIINQTVVGSFDPNDKTCLEGNVIKPELIGEYVHYLIRFENTGTYKAENIVVKDIIDLSKFDISTLMPTSASHSYITKISDGNKVEFIFEKVNLPFDDANNDGYIAFKIKTLPTLKVGDSFTNEANIYFDYNFPILTNKETSTFKTLGTQDFEFSSYFNIYPNPVKDVLNIGLKSEIEKQSMSVYNISGQLIIAVPNAQNTSEIDVSKLQAGNYILAVKTNKGKSNVKFIKK